MPVCVFKTEDIQRCIEHALRSTEWNMGYEETAIPTPGLCFVHDQGVYIMSNGSPSDMDGEQTAYVAFAEHCNPRVDTDWWENSRSLVGGDDFVEVMPIDESWRRNCGRYDEIHVTVTEGEMSWAFAKPKRIVRVT